MYASLPVSIIIPVYNVAPYIGEALDSIFRQNPPFKKIIIIDDGSNDGTRSIITRYDDHRILYHHQENQGLGPARNKGIELADTDYLYFMDGDDVLTDNMTRLIAEALETTQPRPDAVFFSAIDFKDGVNEICASSRYFAWKAPGTYATGRDAMHAVLHSKSFPVCAFTYVFSRSALKGKIPLRFLNILHEDEVFTPDLLLRCGTVKIIDRVLYRRRVRPGSIMTTPVSIKNVIGYMTAAQFWFDLRKRIPGGDYTLYNLEAHKHYSNAVATAARGNISLVDLTRIVKDMCPYFLYSIKMDFALSLLSRKLARNLIKVRAQLMASR